MNGDDGMIAVDHITSECVGKSVAFSLADMPWHYFDFKGCPKRGGLFKIFVSDSQLQKEKFYLREFFALHLGIEMYFLLQYSVMRKRIPNPTDELWGAVLLFTTSHDDTFKILGFNSYKAASSYLFDIAKSYAFSQCNAEEIYKDFSYVFMEHLKKANLKDIQPLKIMMQTTPFFISVISMVKEDIANVVNNI